MEKWKSPDWKEEERERQRAWDERPAWADEVEPPATQEQRFSIDQTIRNYEKELKRRSTRRKWTGAGLFLLGVATTTTSCPFYAMALIGPHTMLVGLAMLVAGGLLFSLQSRLKDTTRAMMIALKHGNSLTVTKLAIEMYITVKRAEKIIQELVGSGIAEIDLDQRGPDDVLIYRLKGY